MLGEDVCKQHPIFQPLVPKLEHMAIQNSASRDILSNNIYSNNVNGDFMKPSLIPQKAPLFQSHESLISKDIKPFQKKGLLGPISSLRKVFRLPELKDKSNASVQCQSNSEDVGIQCNLLQAADVTNVVTNNHTLGQSNREQSQHQDEMINDAHLQQQQQQEHNVFDINIVMDFSRHYPPTNMQRSVSDVGVHHSPEMQCQQIHPNNSQQKCNNDQSYQTDPQADDNYQNNATFFLPPVDGPSEFFTDPCDPNANDHFHQTHSQQQLQYTSFKSQTICLPDISHRQTISNTQRMNYEDLICQKLSTLMPIMEEHSSPDRSSQASVLPDGELQRSSIFSTSAAAATTTSFWSNENSIDYLSKTKQVTTEEQTLSYWEDMTTAMVQPGMSRIPKAAGLPPKYAATDHRRTASAPSKLEQLQAEYQQKLLREKEQKLIEMYERNTQQALQKTNVQNMYNRHRNTTPPSSIGLPPSGAGSASNKGGSVRDFFNQRRNNENGWVNNNNNEYWRTQSMRSPGAHQRPMVVPNRGLDKGQPLAPLQQQPNSQPKIQQGRYRPHPPPQPNTQRQREFIPDDADSRIRPTSKEPLPAIPLTQHNGQKSKIHQWKRDAKTTTDDIPVEIMDAPKINEKKISDFHKWQQEQDQQRAERIKSYKEKQQQQQPPKQQNPGSARYTPEQKRKFLQLKNRQGSFTQYSDEENEEEENKQPQSTRRGSSRAEQDVANKKKKELEDMIAKEKAELIQSQKKRQKEDAKEERERERERKRQAAQEERLRKMREEEDKERRRQEEIAEQEKQRQQAQKNKRNAAKPKQRRNPPPPPPDEDDGPEPPKIDNTAFYEKLSADAGYEQVNLAECSICGRKFAADRLEKHKMICAKSSSKKRKVFDPVKMRTQGTEQEQYARDLKRKPPSPPPQKKNNWRKKHEDFMKTMQYNKKLAAIEASGGNAADLPPPPPSENPDYVQCPTCSRKFNPTAAERHIPRCKDIKSRPPPQKKR